MSSWLNQEMTSSKFAMWRAAIGVLHIDGKIDESERRWFQEKIKSMAFTSEQKRILQHDFDQKVDFNMVLPEVTERKDRSFLLHLVRTLSYLDHDYSDKEQDIFNNLHREIVGELNLEEMERDILESEYDENQTITNDKRSLIGKGLDFLANLLG